MIEALIGLFCTTVYCAIAGLAFIVLDNLYNDDDHPAWGSVGEGRVLGAVLWPVLFIPVAIIAFAAIRRERNERQHKAAIKLLQEEGLYTNED